MGVGSQAGDRFDAGRPHGSREVAADAGRANDRVTG
jgi:hypothetical protein